MREDFLGLISTVMEELVIVVDLRLRILHIELVNGFPWGHRVTLKEFDAFETPCFFGSTDPILSMCWISDVESAFCACFCPTEDKSDLKHALCTMKLRIGGARSLRVSKRKQSIL
ncbi:unnamed protein product [Lactuca saligna]|uniref:Uncharacterized protein n=1 Tax=Lactuca saligna TaxID=75948 RepID=A0AA35VMB7_LACSI|nr:unnamed protein product [Lactuca saligna]